MLKTTPLHASHVALGAKMGEFASYDMPLFYPDGVMKEHEWVRAHAGLFDVSHMGQITVTGNPEHIIKFWEHMTPSSFGKAKDGAAKYTVLTNEFGGMVDDLIVTRITADNFFAVINAGRKKYDLVWLREYLPDTLKLEYAEEQALIALQGPASEKVLRDVFGLDTSAQGYMTARHVTIDGAPCFLSRLGYTGEDGFELSIAPDIAAAVWDKLLAHPEVKPIGLAARDSLRLEMGYPLYGHDIDEKTTPLEADLAWVMGKENTGFVGAKHVLHQKEKGPSRKRIGLKLTEAGVAREGAEIRDAQDKKIGMLTSGGFAPSLKQSIGMGYVDSNNANVGEKIFVNVRGRNIAAEICAMPFVRAKTKNKKAA